ncbi:ABC transporter ATP-binding protein [Sporanaerobium hydrogeniformans]|uniref:ABC transporter ATP-binding protein n=1 Tax=Sporanaerobium hydrogeniformans TaxID=3072179 RepID=A0AC61DBE2_9FIRM|nr:ABC transporter ATP-binding protein [Sporanaerobium hydrogeniformans]PHV70546.1 ABC transporter ATP-binding protein [Sporanaerobium hydrogeniformans]
MFLEVQDLVKSYQTGENAFFAVNQATLKMEAGEIVVILGPSGSGKSTLLNLIGGLEKATSGSIKIEGNEICNLSSKQLGIYRRNFVGFVFQFYNLIPNLTVRENIEICAHLGKNPLAIDTLIDKVGLHAESHKFPSQLSGGQQQRVAVARALVKNPKLLLCDEPTGALDYKTSKEVLELFEEINKTYNTTMLMITHNDAIKDMSHRIIRIKDGRITHNTLNTHRKHAKDIDW